MSMISSPAAISAPSPTSQRATMPSCIARPHLGMTTDLIASLIGRFLPSRSQVGQFAIVRRTAASILSGPGM